MSYRNGYVLALAHNFGNLAKETLAGGRSESIVIVDMK
jgi:hypothetical protein